MAATATTQMPPQSPAVRWLSTVDAAPPDADLRPSITVNFVAEVNGEAFDCGSSFSNVGIGNDTIDVTDLKM